MTRPARMDEMTTASEDDLSPHALVLVPSEAARVQDLGPFRSGRLMETDLLPGSALIARANADGAPLLDADGLVRFSFEGGANGAVNVRLFHEKCLVAAGRLATSAPSIAYGRAHPEELRVVARYDLLRYVFTDILDRAALEVWAGEEVASFLPPAGLATPTTDPGGHAVPVEPADEDRAAGPGRRLRLDAHGRHRADHDVGRTRPCPDGLAPRRSGAAQDPPSRRARCRPRPDHQLSPETPMSYTRVLPRDLFNEAGLLKAVGRVIILLGETDGHRARVAEEQLDSFDIVQDETSGGIRIANITFEASGREYYLERPLNSRESWALEARLPDWSEEAIEVFELDGDFTAEMRALIFERTA